MRQQLVRGLHKTQETVAAFSTPQKIIAVVGVALLILGGTAFARWASTPTMVPLFTNLAATDAGAVTTELDAQGIAYQMGGDGTSVMVSRQDLQNARIKLAAQGLPANSKGGYAVLDEQGMNSSEFKQSVAWQRAMEGELAMTISAMDGVQSAVVHLALPKRDVFADETPAPTASVMVTMPATGNLAAERVQAIVHLVSSGIPDMTPDNVTVVDSAGALLSAAGGSGATTMAEQQQAEAASRVRQSIQAMLDKVVGPGNSVATAQVELDNDMRNSTTEVFTDPDVKPLRDSTVREEFDGNGGAATGVLGPDNIQVPGGEAGGDSNYLKETGTRENSVNKETTHTTGRGARVARQSVSVMVNEQVAATLDMDRLTESISAAAGINIERGDTLAVTALPFDEKAAEEAAAALEEAQKAAEREQLIGIAKTGAIALAIIILAIVAFVISRRRDEEDEVIDEEYFDDLALPAAPQEDEKEEAAPETVAAAAAKVPDMPLELPAGEQDPAYEAMREEIVGIVNNQPDEVAELLRGWLADRRS